MCSHQVDILMAAYNGEKYIAEQIESLQQQTFTDWRLLVSDDGSSDTTPSIIKKYEGEDSRIRIVLADEHYGSAKNHFLALLQCTDAPYVMFCDQDDVWDKDKIELTLQAMRQEESEKAQPLLVATDLRVVDENLSLIAPSFKTYAGMGSSRTEFGYFLASALITGCTMMLNRQLVELLTSDIDSSRILMHDWWFALVASAYGKVTYLNKPTISYRQHGDNSVGAYKRSAKKLIRDIKARRRNEKRTLQQAAYLKELYSKTLPARSASQLNAYLAIPEAKPLQRVGLINKADIWRTSFVENALTLYIFMTINMK